MMKKLLLMCSLCLLFLAACEEDLVIQESSNTVALSGSLPTEGIEGDTLDYGIVFLGPVSSSITVNYELTGALTEPGTATIPAGSASGTIRIPIPENTVLNPERRFFFLELTGTSGAGLSDRFTIETDTIDILDDPKVIAFENDTISVSEGIDIIGDTLNIPITISNNLDNEITLDYTISGSADENIDFELLGDNPLVIESDTSSATISFRIIDDVSLNDPSVRLNIELSALTTITGDTETSISTTMSNIVVEIMDDLKVIGFSRDSVDTLMISSQGNFLEELISSNELILDTEVNLTLDLPAGITSNSGSSTNFLVGQTSNQISLNANPDNFDEDNSVGSIEITSITDNGDSEISVSESNFRIIIQTGN
ncbi:MAG: Calx-beta domain-containing protein [Bacteroidota bacterium]